jgi:osmotically-inducible protein OsmY
MVALSLSSFCIHAVVPDRHELLVKNTIENKNKIDQEFTMKLRASIIADKMLSSAAHDVKIITVRNTVTLAGVVASKEEKIRIEQLAKNKDKTKIVFNNLTY